MSRSRVKKKRDLAKVFLIVVVMILAGISGFLYYQINQWESVFEAFQNNYSMLRDEYDSLREIYSNLRDEYVVLQEMYSTLRSEYSDLQNRHAALEKEKTVLQNEKIALQNEYDEIRRLEKRVILEKDRVLELEAGGYAILQYDTVFAGYVEVNFTASVDIYFWVGSSLTQDTYYARYPPFPYTATNGTVNIPVCSRVYLRIENPNALTGAVITLTITCVY